MPAITPPIASKASSALRSRPPARPGRVEPPKTKMPGALTRRIPIIMPGRFLSQPPTATTPSKQCARMVASMLSAISSREISEKRMPAWAMVSPSDTETTGVSCA